MKKLVLITMASTAAAFGAYAQGSLDNVQALFSSYGVTFGTGQTTSSASSYFTGNVSIELLYSSTATAGTVTALNAFDGVANGGASALAAAQGDGFVNVLASSVTSLSAGALQYAVSGGDFTGADANEVGLLSVPTGGSGVLALYAVELASGNPNGGAAGWSGLLAWTQGNFGGNPNATPVAGTPAHVQQDPGAENLDLTSVPEPATLAVAGLGGLSLMLFRRRK